MGHEDVWDILDVDDWVDVAALTPIVRFYPSAVSQATKIPSDIVFRRLLEISREGLKLDLKWEIRCPQYDCIRTVHIFDTLPEQIIGTEFECICGNEFEVVLEDIYPAFEIKDRYKARVQSKKKTEEQHKFSVSDIEASMLSGGSPADRYLTPEMLAMLMSASSPAAQVNILLGGNLNMTSNSNNNNNINSNNRTMRGVSFQGATFNGNANFQGDNVNQTMTTSGPSDDLFQALYQDINSKIADQDERQDALDDAKKLQEAVEADNPERKKKFFDRLPSVVQTAAAAIAIAQAFGIPVPAPGV